MFICIRETDHRCDAPWGFNQGALIEPHGCLTIVNLLQRDIAEFDE